MSLKSILESHDNIRYDLFLKGLTEDTVRKISLDQKEPKWMLDLRLNALKIFHSKTLPSWWPDLSKLDLNTIVYYAKPHQENKWYATDRKDVPKEMKEKFKKLWIPEAEAKYLAGAGGQYDSLNIYHNIKKQREEKWIIFKDMPEAIREHEELVKKYFMTLVPPTDHKFAALHAAVRSGWTFIYIPKWVQLNEPLQAYFRMNTYAWWQFEHTLIIIEDEAEWSYIEWCSAPKYDKASLHAWCVEIYVGKNAKMKYASVENWSTNTYNLNTKRAIIQEDGYMEWVSGNLWSSTTMLYPCSILQWDRSKTDLLGIAVAGKHQHQDIGAKVIHIGKHTSSKIISKSICKEGWVNTYRWLVKIAKHAEKTVNFTQCDALLLDNKSVSNTVPIITSDNETSVIAHEAKAGKIDEAQLFYLTSRWIDDEKAIAMIINGFFSSVVKKLPLEYAWELNKLIEIEMEK